MSQTSTSRKSSGGRKRRASTEFASQSQQSWVKTRRTMLTLNKRSLERWNQSTNESMIIIDDDDTQSNTSISISTAATSVVNASEPDYVSLATQFALNITAVRKHYSILISRPRVSIVRIKPEDSPTSSIQPLIASPVFGSKRKAKNSKIKVKPIPIDFSPEKSFINNTVNKNIEDYFDTLENTKVKDEIISISSPDSPGLTSKKSRVSKSKALITFPKWDINDSSGDEFDKSKKNNTNNSAGKTQNAATKSVSRKKSKPSDNSPVKKPKNFWKTEIESHDPTVKKWKIIKTFEKKKKKSNDLVNGENDEVIYVGSSPIREKENDNSQDKNKGNKKVGKKLMKRIRQSRSKSNSSSIDTCAEASVVSLSVNCQALSSMASIKVNNADLNNIDQNVCPTSFGDKPDLPDQEANNNMDGNIENVDHSQFNVESVNLNCIPIHMVGDNMEKVNEDEADQSIILNDSFVSLDLFDSLEKIDEQSSTKVPVRSSTPEPIIPKDINIPKAKPINISDSTFPDNTTVLPVFKNVTPSKIQQNTDTNDSSEVETLSGKSQITVNRLNDNEEKAIENSDNSKFVQLEFNGTTKSNTDLKTIPSKPNCTKSPISQKTICPNSESNAKGGKLKCPIVDNIVEESFDSLCQDVCKLSNNENITLYKGDGQVHDKGNTSNEKVLQLQNNTLQNPDFKLPTLFDNNANETQLPTEKLVHNPSPLIFRRSPPIKLSLKTGTAIKTQKISSLSAFARFKQQHELQQPYAQKCIPSQSTLSAFNTNNTINKDPRLNRSISPIKSSSVSERDPRLNRSLSPLKSSTIVTDPRLISRLNCRSNIAPDVFTPKSGEKDIESKPNVDPRLRKRKEREEAEKAAKTAEVKVEGEVSNESNISIQSPGKRRRLSVFERLGSKRSKSLSPSPERKSENVTNEFLNVVKAGRGLSLDKTYDSEDDQLHLHPNEEFSSDEESNASPRHRKFTSERTRLNEEIRNQPISVKDRLSWNTQTNSKSMSEITTGRTIIRLRQNVNGNSQRQSVQAPQSMQQTLKKPISLQSRVPNGGPINTSFIDYGNNDVAFNDKFYKMNALQMLRDVDNYKMQESDTNTYVTFSKDGLDQPCKFDHISILDAPSEPVQIGACDVRSNFFRSYCYRMLRKGKCLIDLNSCQYSHKIQILKIQIQKKKADDIFSILDIAIQNKFEHFLQSIWSSILPILQNEAFTVYNKLYQADMRSEQFLYEFLDYCLNLKLHTVESFVKRISPIIRKGDKETVRVICVAIKNKLTDGFCWEAIKDLCQKAVPPRDMLELTLLQCLTRKKNQAHINEVYDLVKNRLSVVERNKISPNLLTQFFNLIQSKDARANKEIFTTLPLVNVTSNINNVPRGQITTRHQSVESIQSLENERSVTPVRQPGAISMTTKNKKATAQRVSPIRVPTSNVQQPNNSPLEVGITTPNKGESTNFSEYSVAEVDSSEPQSSFRDRFWKLYLIVNNINTGLNHVDYEFVWKVMDEFSKENIQDELLKRAYYHILCKNVKSCETHVSEIIKQAVRRRWASSTKSVDLLFDVGVCALVDLANSDLWVMALQLLSLLKIIEPNELRTAFVLISAEIYLANNDPLEALYLLQQTRLIRTNRDEWLTKDSTKKDEKHRNKLVFILLKALSYSDPENAMYIFKTLLVDQYISYYPIDLPLYLDKLTLLLLLHNKEEFAADLCRIVMDTDLTFKKTTYQDLLCHMLPYDEVLANQLLDYAIHLGYYYDIQIRSGFTTVTIDMNCMEEEIYLILKRLIHKLTLSIGPVIPRLKPSQLKVILVFEDIPDEKRLYRNEIVVTKKDNYKNVRNTVNRMLATRFTPPIRITRWKTDKFCKIVSRTLVDHLQHWN